MLPSYTKTVKRRVQVAPKFYYFDVGITNYRYGIDVYG